MAYTDIDKPSDYFNTKLYTGNGSTNAITGVGFQPDWVWIKERNGASGHIFKDSVRGVTPTLVSNSTGAESAFSAYFTSFDSDGFTLPNNTATNESASFNYVAWNWLASNTTASNTDGSITSTVSANTTSGFSIVSYTGNGVSGSTVGHGLNQKPELFIVRSRNGASARSWFIYDAVNGATKYLRFDTNASTTSSVPFNNTEPTDNVFSVDGTGGYVGTNGSTEDYIAYCFAPKKGFSKIGSYTGNGSSTNNTFVYTGFKPAFLIIKRTNSTSNWTMWDTARQENEINKPLWADLSNAESAQTTVKLDLLSNGFKIRGNGTNVGASASTYIYMCFASNPFVTSGGIPTTAR